MSAPGRRPKPTAMKVLAGNPGKRPLNKQEPQIGAAKARVPKGKLPKDGAHLWRALAGPLSNAGVLKESDLPALEMLCLHYAVARAALAELISEAGGIGVTTAKDDEIKKHPAASVFRENSMAFKAYLTEFGLTPSSRVRIKIDDHEQQPSLAEMLFSLTNG